MTSDRPSTKPFRPSCPRCKSRARQVRNGKNPSGTPRMRCGKCGRYYTLTPKEKGHPYYVVIGALWLYIQYRNYRRVARLCGVNQQTVFNWVKKYGSEFVMTQSDVSLLKQSPIAKYIPGLVGFRPSTNEAYFIPTPETPSV